MRTIFEEGTFNSYSNVELSESREAVLIHSQYGIGRKTTVFISHSHDDLNDLKGILGFCKKTTVSKFILTAKTQLCQKQLQQKQR